MKNRIMLILMAALLCVLLLPAMASADQASYGDPLTDENGDVYDLGGMEIIVRDWWSPAEPADPVNEYERARQDYINWIQQTYNFKIRQVGLSSRDSAVIDFLEYAQSDPDENNYIFVLYNDPALVAAMRTGLA